LIAAFNELRASGDELVREIVIPATGLTLLTHWAHMVVDGKDQGVVAVFHDISDMKRVENMRRDFVANVSHELRTPVSVIKGYAETLLDGLVETDPERAKRFIQIVLHHSERLASLINDILTLSHLESKDTALEFFNIDLSATIRKAGMLLQETAARKNIVIRDESPAPVSKVMADQGRLEQVLVNGRWRARAVLYKGRLDFGRSQGPQRLRFRPPLQAYSPVGHRCPRARRLVL
jgi:two-component system phosphate regulon sensor histidine kinase PhoR